MLVSCSTYISTPVSHLIMVISGCKKKERGSRQNVNVLVSKYKVHKPLVISCCYVHLFYTVCEPCLILCVCRVYYNNYNNYNKYICRTQEPWRDSWPKRKSESCPVRRNCGRSQSLTNQTFPLKEVQKTHGGKKHTHSHPVTHEMLDLHKYQNISVSQDNSDPLGHRGSNLLEKQRNR